MINNEPKFKTQLDESGNIEKIDISKFNIMVLCSELGCNHIRYIKIQDRGQTKFCKPCSRKRRLASRARRAREARNKQRSHSS